MDVRKAAALVTLSFFLNACGESATEEDVFPLDAPKCESSSIKNQFIVRWKSGRRTLERGENRAQFLRDFVKPNLGALEHVEHNRRIAIDPLASLRTRSAGQADNWGAIRTHVDEAWSAGARGQGVIVAVVDSGVDITHQQLSTRIAYNKGEVPNNGLDDDLNGYVDDYSGYDFAGERNLTADYGSHGTHVSGIVLASHEDESAAEADHVQGIAPEAKLIPIAFIDGSGGGSLFNAIRAVDYARVRGAQVVNASWGGADCSPELRSAIERLGPAVFIAAAGNNGQDIDRAAEYPAAYDLPNQLTVGALGATGWQAEFSNYGLKRVHILAPGVDIFSTVPGNGIMAMSGTSMAAPFVSGAVALLLSHRPGASAAQIRQALYRSAVTNVFYENASQGTLDFSSALRELERLLP